MEEKHPCHNKLCAFIDDFGTSKYNSDVLKFKEYYFFLENYLTSEGAVSHNVSCYQRLSIASTE